MKYEDDSSEKEDGGEVLVQITGPDPYLSIIFYF
jgi:hypothetical protein